MEFLYNNNICAVYIQYIRYPKLVLAAVWYLVRKGFKDNIFDSISVLWQCFVISWRKHRNNQKEICRISTVEPADLKISIPFYLKKGYNSNEWKDIIRSKLLLLLIFIKIELEGSYERTHEYTNR
jgi:hypothetical protein